MCKVDLKTLVLLPDDVITTEDAEEHADDLQVTCRDRKKRLSFSSPVLLLFVSRACLGKRSLFLLGKIVFFYRVLTCGLEGEHHHAHDIPSCPYDLPAAASAHDVAERI